MDLDLDVVVEVIAGVLEHVADGDEAFLTADDDHPTDGGAQPGHFPDRFSHLRDADDGSSSRALHLTGNFIYNQSVKFSVIFLVNG